MKRKIAFTGYVLWGIAFILTALAVTALVSLPFYLGMFVYGWFGPSGSIPYQLVYVLLGVVLTIPIALLIARTDRMTLEKYAQMILVCVLLSCACFVFISIPRKEESFRSVIKVLGIINAVVALIGILYYGVEAKNEYYKRLIGYCSYPKDKEFLIGAIAKGKYDRDIRLDALKLLPYPEERETIVQTAIHHEDGGFRWAAMQKLPYPEEGETLAQIARGDPEASLRIAAIRTLSYPEAKDTLLQCLASDPEFSPRKEALNKLPLPIESQPLLSMVGFCEKTLQSIHLNKMDQKTEEIANTLIELYQQINPRKTAVRRHAGKHTDETVYSDDTEFRQCVWADHSDSSQHMDQGHDDYYEITEKA